MAGCRSPNELQGRQGGQYRDRAVADRRAAATGARLVALPEVWTYLGDRSEPAGERRADSRAD